MKHKTLPPPPEKKKNTLNSYHEAMQQKTQRYVGKKKQDLGVSKNKGYPKWMVYNGKSY